MSPALRAAGYVLAVLQSLGALAGFGAAALATAGDPSERLLCAGGVLMLAQAWQMTANLQRERRRAQRQLEREAELEP